MQRYEVGDITALVDSIGAGNPDPEDEGPVVVEIRIWDGRIVRGSYYRGAFQPHITDETDFIRDSNRLLFFVEQLVSDGGGGHAFIMETGESDMICTLIWEMVS